jgi:hypothetical protein
MFFEGLSKFLALGIFDTTWWVFLGIYLYAKLYLVVHVIQPTFAGGKFLNVKHENLVSRLGSSLMVTEALSLGRFADIVAGFKKQNVIV